MADSERSADRYSFPEQQFAEANQYVAKPERRFAKQQFAKAKQHFGEQHFAQAKQFAEQRSTYSSIVYSSIP